MTKQSEPQSPFAAMQQNLWAPLLAASETFQTESTKMMHASIDYAAAMMNATRTLLSNADARG